MQVEVLSADQSEAWHRAIGQMPQADVYYTPEYCRLYEDNGEGAAQLFVYREGELLICYPYLLRNVNELPLFRELGLQNDYYDIITPYGYGGPISNAGDPEARARLFAAFGGAFADYCRERRIVSEFVRFHPIIRNHEDYLAVDPTFARNTVCIDLRLSEADIAAKFTKDCRNRIRRAQGEEGLHIHHAGPGQIDRFMELYYSTMSKLEASNYYFFPEQLFRSKMKSLGAHTELIEVKLGDQVILSTIFLHYNKYVHYHLTGSMKEYLKISPTNFLLDHAVKWAKAEGYHYLHLGGGHSGNDNLYRFKKNFNQEESLDFHIGRKVHNLELYRAIERKVGDGFDDYFPIYRHPGLTEPLKQIG